jgi:hypothetical protein
MDKAPVFAKSGAIIPMANFADYDNRLFNSEDMTVLVFPGASNTFTLYEDAGEGNEYANGAFATTKMELAWGEKPEFTLNAAQGDLALIPQRRTWRIGLRGFYKGICANVCVNGKTICADTRWEQETNTLWVCVEADVHDNVTIAINGEKLLCDNSDVDERIGHILQFAHCTTLEKKRITEKLNDPKGTLLSKYNFLISIAMLGSVGGAIMELLCLTSNHYRGTNYPGSELPE